MTKTFVWLHNGSDDPKDSVAFYEELLGWKGSDGPGMTMLARGAGPVRKFGRPFAAMFAK
jgi:hypothetical protein